MSETLTTQHLPSTESTPKLVDRALTDEAIYGSEGVPAVILAEREKSQERYEQNVARHAENIVYATEIVDMADSLLKGNDSFSHSERVTRDGVKKFEFGSFDISRSQLGEHTQQYVIHEIAMGYATPVRSEYRIVITDGKVNIQTFQENSPAEMRKPKPQRVERPLSWNSDSVMDVNDLTKGSEQQVSTELAKMLSFMERHSEAVRTEQEKRSRKTGRFALKF